MLSILSALAIDVTARHLSEEYSDDEDSGVGSGLGMFVGIVVLLLCCCFYCACRESANRFIGCPEASYCGLGSDQDSEVCGSACGLVFGTVRCRFHRGFSPASQSPVIQPAGLGRALASRDPRKPLTRAAILYLVSSTHTRTLCELPGRSQQERDRREGAAGACVRDQEQPKRWRW